MALVRVYIDKFMELSGRNRSSGRPQINSFAMLSETTDVSLTKQMQLFQQFLAFTEYQQQQQQLQQQQSTLNQDQSHFYQHQ
ncbi:hypothetical protein GGI15_002002 [Coemansia interrupta]|uniref:Uncharacterized protein n=1 Tax=Coemansia interrupta TaxID=1126814 RepID=A0A9W8HHK1_9FUNG|nr:hypothetical protein GGI15_002002 [Coemansia interrupta]